MHGKKQIHQTQFGRSNGLQQNQHVCLTSRLWSVLLEIQNSCSEYSIAFYALKIHSGLKHQQVKALSLFCNSGTNIQKIQRATRGLDSRKQKHIFHEHIGQKWTDYLGQVLVQGVPKALSGESQVKTISTVIWKHHLSFHLHFLQWSFQKTLCVISLLWQPAYLLRSWILLSFNFWYLNYLPQWRIVPGVFNH